MACEAEDTARCSRIAAYPDYCVYMPQFTQVTYLLTISMLHECIYSKTAFLPPLRQHLLAKVTCRPLASSVM